MVRPLGSGKLNCCYLALSTDGAWPVIVHEVAKSRTRLSERASMCRWDQGPERMCVWLIQDSCLVCAGQVSSLSHFLGMDPVQVQCWAMGLSEWAVSHNLGPGEIRV